jgi:predicted negative regulator of RcsB-dependent stress response
VDRITRKDLKTDKFAQEVTHTVEYVGVHRKLFVQIGAAAVVLVLAVIAFWTYRERNKVQLQDELAETMRVMEGTVGQPSPNPQIPSFATQADKDKAANKAFNDFVSKHSGTDEAYVVKYYLAILASDAGKLPEAGKDLQDVVSSAPSGIASLAKFSLAQIYWAENKKADAEKLMRSLIDKPTAMVTKEQAEIALARMLADTNPAEARKLLEPLRSNPRAPVSRTAIAALSDIPATK